MSVQNWGAETFVSVGFKQSMKYELPADLYAFVSENFILLYKYLRSNYIQLNSLATVGLAKLNLTLEKWKQM